MATSTPADSTGPLPGVPFPHRIVSAERRHDLKREIDVAHETGLLSDLVFRSYSRIFD